MITLAVPDDLEEVLKQVERDTGQDMSAMRDIAAEIVGMPVGDSTPAPGTLKALVAEPEIIFAPPQHEGWAMPPDGKFFVRDTTPPVTRQVRRLSKRLTRLTYFVAGFAMCFVSSLAVIAYRWNG